MPYENYLETLCQLINEEWGNASISIHNRITNIRFLLNLLKSKFEKLDDIAVEIETLSGTALGMENMFLCKEEQKLLKENIIRLKQGIDSI